MNKGKGQLLIGCSWVLGLVGTANTVDSDFKSTISN